MWNLNFLGVAALITLALSAGSAWFGYSSGRQSGMNEVQTLWDSEKQLLTEIVQQQALLAQQRQQTIDQQAAQARRIQREANNRIATLERDLADSLRDRPEERAGPGGVPETADSGVGCTGAGLARSDAEFLARYSADAARLHAALATCTAAVRALGGTVID